jgi:predicted Abi (CAAX) family protease
LGNNLARISTCDVRWGEKLAQDFCIKPIIAITVIKQHRRLLILLVIATSTSSYIYYKNQTNNLVALPSNYHLYQQFIRDKNNYSLAVDRNNLNHRPVSLWTGRLILPAPSPNKQHSFVELEVENTPPNHINLIGKTVKLEWIDNQKTKVYLNAVTKDVVFTEDTIDSQKIGNLHPTRLKNLKNVDPLQSLAGARDNNDVIVAFAEPIFVSKIKEEYVLKIENEPIQITGRQYALIQIVRLVDRDKFLVRHFNLKSGSFQGSSEVIQIPESPRDRTEISRFANLKLVKSWYNSSGWYIYGTRNKDGIFIVQAMIPRKIVRLIPDTIRVGKSASISYVNNEMWDGTSLRKGTTRVALVESEKANWQEGDRALVIHVYGGIGGSKAEPKTYGIVTGHFAYGIANIIREPLSNELIFDVKYHQIYAHNPDGIVAGKIQAYSYLGDLKKGWLGNRPIADVIVKFDPVTQDYNFDGIELSPLNEFSFELQKMMARYRIGDGTGAATVSPVTSCVQDANQALYLTIKRITQKIKTNPKIQAWLDRHPNHSQTQRFHKLVKLGEDLEKNLVPLGIVRRDWQQNADELAGTKQPENFLDSIFKGVLSWRTILPRRAHDEITTILLQNGASAWIVRTNQLGGFNPDITPLAPNVVFGGNSN